MKTTQMTVAATAAIATAAGAANAQITITQQNAAAPTYATTLNFDEPGQATGLNPGDTWQSIGIKEMIGGANDINVDDWDSIVGGWGLGSGNSAYGPFGVFTTFQKDLTEFSTQAWDTSGPPSPFGGGMGIFVFQNGVEVANGFFNPAYGGIGDSWFNITTANGHKFDEVRILGFGFPADTYVDNMSWNMVPTPASAAVLGLGGLVALRRRR